MNKTLNGYDLNSLPIILDQVLPNSAYKKIPAGSLDLTDVDANWQKRVFNKIFGMYGLGWGFDFEREDLEIRFEQGTKREVPYVRVVGKFWYRFVNEDGNTEVAAFTVTGANNSQTGNEGYALKGAITNAIGFAGSMLGWQESIYLGARSHNNTGGFAPGKHEVDIEDFRDIQEPEPHKGYEAPKNPPRQPEPTPKPEPEKPPVGEVEKPTLASKLGFETKPEPVLEPMKYLLCIKCGWAEPVNTIPEVCPKCEVVKDEAFTDCKSRPHMLECQKNTLDRIQREKGKSEGEQEIKETAERSKKALEEIKSRTGNDRRLILQGLSETTGRRITSYPQASLAELEQYLQVLNDTAENPTPPQGESTDKPVGDKPFPPDRTGLCRAILSTSMRLKFGSARQAITRIGEIAGKDIKSLTDLSDKELQGVLGSLWEMEKEL